MVHPLSGAPIRKEYAMSTKRLVRCGLRSMAAALAAVLWIGWTGSAARAGEPITDDNVVAAIAAAKSPADHHVLAAYFTSKAEAAEASAENHDQMSTAFNGKAHERMATHCRSLASADRKQAKDYTALAHEQEALSKEPSGRKGNSP